MDFGDFLRSNEDAQRANDEAIRKRLLQQREEEARRAAQQEADRAAAKEAVGQARTLHDLTGALQKRELLPLAQQQENDVAQEAANKERRQLMIDNSNQRDLFAKEKERKAGELDSGLALQLGQAGIDPAEYMKWREAARNPATADQATHELGLMLGRVSENDATLAHSLAGAIKQDIPPLQPGAKDQAGGTTHGFAPGNGVAAPLPSAPVTVPGAGVVRSESGQQWVLGPNGQIERSTYDPNNPNPPTQPPLREQIQAGQIGEPPAPPPPAAARLAAGAVGAAQDVASGVAGYAKAQAPNLAIAADALTSGPKAALDAAGNAITGVAKPAVEAGMKAAGAVGDTLGYQLQDKIHMATALAKELFAKGLDRKTIYDRLAAHFPDLASLGPGEASAAEIPGDTVSAEEKARRMAAMGDLSQPAPVSAAATANDRRARIQALLDQLPDTLQNRPQRIHLMNMLDQATYGR